MNGWMDGWMDGWKGERMNGRMNGWNGWLTATPADKNEGRKGGETHERKQEITEWINE